MWDFSTTTIQRASKDYHCDASDWLQNDCIEDFTEEEQAIYHKAESEGFKILKGTLYTKTTGKYEGEFGVFRARIDLNNICLGSGVYDNY